MSEKQKENEMRSKDALRRANYNEQYSRKNNIKIANVPEGPAENEKILEEKVQQLLHKHGVDLATQEIVAIHRIPTRNEGARPILIKTLNNNVKARVMRKRKEVKRDGYRLSDDVTQLNSGLINRLLKSEAIISAWFFNGSVYGETSRNERVKFDIHDPITEVISAFRQKQRR